MFLPISGVFLSLVVLSFTKIIVHSKDVSNDFQDSVVDVEDATENFKATRKIAGIQFAFQPENMNAKTNNREVLLKSSEMDWLFDGIRMRFFSPREIVIKINKETGVVQVNGKKVCEGAQKRKPYYQRSRDGAIWFTNCQVGKKVTGDDIVQVKEKLDERTQYLINAQETSRSMKKAQRKMYRKFADNLAEERRKNADLRLAWQKIQLGESSRTFKQILGDEIKKREQRRQHYLELLNKQKEKCKQHEQEGLKIIERVSRIASERLEKLRQERKMKERLEEENKEKERLQLNEELDDEDQTSDESEGLEKLKQSAATLKEETKQQKWKTKESKLTMTESKITRHKSSCSQIQNVELVKEKLKLAEEIIKTKESGEKKKGKVSDENRKGDSNLKPGYELTNEKTVAQEVVVTPENGMLKEPESLEKSGTLEKDGKRAHVEGVSQTEKQLMADVDPHVDDHQETTEHVDDAPEGGERIFNNLEQKSDGENEKSNQEELTHTSILQTDSQEKTEKKGQDNFSADQTVEDQKHKLNHKKADAYHIEGGELASDHTNTDHENADDESAVHEDDIDHEDSDHVRTDHVEIGDQNQKSSININKSNDCSSDKNKNIKISTGSEDKKKPNGSTLGDFLT